MYNPKDTICAIATPPGESALAIVRASGDESRVIIERLFRGSAALEDRRATFGEIIDGDGKRIDEVVVIWYKGPRSYTGEDLVEIVCHGGHVVSEQILSLLREAGARLAERGEFTVRAFLNGRLDLTEAEAVNSIISAKTAKSKELALFNLEGKLKKRLDIISSRLIDLVSILEAEIDFGDEEVDKLSDREVIERIEDIEQFLEDVISTYDIGRVSEGKARVAIVGAPNVGKSSIFNAILKTGRAIVTERPGTTRDYLSEYVNIDGYPVIMTDTAGIRESEEEIEQFGIERARQLIQESDLCLFVLDASRRCYDDDYQIAELVIDKRHITVVNKIDLIKEGENNIDKNLAQRNILHISAKTSEGIQELLIEIRLQLIKEPLGVSDGIILSHRQYNCALSAQKALVSAKKLVKSKEPEEVYVGEIREALDQVSTITGKITSDDILNRIFSEFCIGK